MGSDADEMMARLRCGRERLAEMEHEVAASGSVCHEVFGGDLRGIIESTDELIGLLDDGAVAVDSRVLEAVAVVEVMMGSTLERFGMALAVEGRVLGQWADAVGRTVDVSELDDN